MKTRMSFFQLRNFFRSSGMRDMEENFAILTERMEQDYNKTLLLLTSIENKIKIKDPIDLHLYGHKLKQFFIRYSTNGMNLYDKTATDHNCIFRY